jgi:hypothetical protein
MRHHALCGVLALVPAIALAATVADGQVAYDGGHYSDARAIWTGLAAAGDPDAEIRLGALYDVGAGVTPDAAAAFCWYRRAAVAGVPEAAFNVAVMQDSGRGAPHDPVAAARWYARAAAAGFNRAEFNLALLYDSGEGVPRNPDVATAWFRAAAAGGVKEAANRIPLRLAGGVAGALQPVALDPPDSVAPAGEPIASVPLTWAAMPQPAGASFTVEVAALDGGAPRPVFIAATERSAILAPLKPGRYAGRVFAVTTGTAEAHYAIGDWTRFTVGVTEAESATIGACKTPCRDACSPTTP